MFWISTSIFGELLITLSRSKQRTIQCVCFYSYVYIHIHIDTRLLYRSARSWSDRAFECCSFLSVITIIFLFSSWISFQRDWCVALFDPNFLVNSQYQLWYENESYPFNRTSLYFAGEREREKKGKKPNKNACTHAHSHINELLNARVNNDFAKRSNNRNATSPS